MQRIFYQVQRGIIERSQKGDRGAVFFRIFLNRDDLLEPSVVDIRDLIWELVNILRDHTAGPQSFADHGSIQKRTLRVFCHSAADLLRLLSGGAGVFDRVKNIRLNVAEYPLVIGADVYLEYVRPAGDYGVVFARGKQEFYKIREDTELFIKQVHQLIFAV